MLSAGHVDEAIVLLEQAEQKEPGRFFVLGALGIAKTLGAEIAPVWLSPTDGRWAPDLAELEAWCLEVAKELVGIKMMGGRVYKTYRIYEKRLG